MECPQCGEKLKMPDHAVMNMQSYHNPVMTITLCCGMAVNGYPKSSYTVEAYEGDKLTDDWGNEIKK